MTWQLLAIWSPVVAMLIWMGWRSRQRKAAALDKRAAHFATAPDFRYEAPAPDPALANALKANRPQPLAPAANRLIEELRRTA